MTSLSRLIAATTLIGATALAPGLASADDHCDGRDREVRREQLRRDERDPRLPASTPEWSWRDDLRWDGRAWVRAGWRGPELGERHARARALRVELIALERDHAAERARFAHHPKKLARSDARYLERRDALERELRRLTWYAWR